MSEQEKQRELSLRIRGRLTKDSAESKFIGTDEKPKYVTRNILAINKNNNTLFLNFEVFSIAPIELKKGQPFEMDASEIDIYAKKIYTVDGVAVEKDTYGAVELKNEAGYGVTENIVTVKVNEKYASASYFEEAAARVAEARAKELEELKAKWRAEWEAEIASKSNRKSKAA